MNSICYIHKDIGDIERGGISTLFKTLAKGLLQNGWQVYCITQQDLNIEGITSIKLPVERDPLKYSQMVTNALREINPDIAECSTWRFELLDYMKSTRRNIKVVVRCEPSTKTLFPNVNNFTLSEKELCELADFKIAVSNFAKDDIEKRYKVRVETIIHNGVDIKELRGLIVKEVQEKFVSLIDQKKINIFWCGKSTQMKGYDYLEKIVETSDKSKFNWIINIGNSPEEVVWKQETKNMVTFVKNISKSEQVNLWSQCDVFLSTSRYEGFGLVVAESLALSVPVVLNSECQVYKEFLPNSNISLIDVKDLNAVFAKLSKPDKKSDNSLLTKNFDSENMILASISAYKKLLS